MYKLGNSRFLLSILLTILLVVSVDARGGRGGGGGSHSSSRSYKSSSSSSGSLFGSGSSSKRSYGTSGSTTRSVGSFFGSKKSSTSKFETAKNKSYGKNGSKATLDSYRGKTTSAVKNRYRNAPVSSNYGYNSRSERRTVFYNTYRVPTFYVSPYSAYGPFDGMFLGMMLGNYMSNAHYSTFMHSHWTDPSIVQWRNEMDRQAVNNAELRGQLNALQSQVNQMKAQGVPVDSNYIPEDVDPDMVYSDEYVDKNATDFYPNMAPPHKESHFFMFAFFILIAILVIRHIFFVRKY